VLMRLNQWGDLGLPGTRLVVGPADPGAQGSFSASTDRLVLAARGVAGQTSNLAQWQDSAGAALAAITAGGQLQFGADSFANLYRPSSAVLRSDANLHFFGQFFGGGGAMSGTGGVGRVNVDTNAVGNVGLVVRGRASQTADLQQWQDSAGAVLVNASAAGALVATSLATRSFAAKLTDEATGGIVQLGKTNAAAANPGADFAKLYIRDGTLASTVKLVVRAGATGTETTILDNITT